MFLCLLQFLRGNYILKYQNIVGGDSFCVSGISINMNIFKRMSATSSMIGLSTNMHRTISANYYITKSLYGR